MLSRGLALSTLPRETRDTLFLLVVIAWVMAPQVGNLPWWCLVLAGSVLGWRAAIAVTGKPLPGRWWIAGLLALALAATWFTHRTLLGRDAGVTMVIVLLALKTLELRARRDAFVVFFLAFFAMVTNFFFSQTLLVAAAMMLGLLGLLTALVNAHMPVGRPPLAEAAKTAAWMALLGAPIMALLFVLFPRFAPLWGIPGDAMTGRSGLSSQMEVGNMAALALDESVAFRVKWEGGQPPAQNDLYFRGPVLSNFDGREWRPLQARAGARFPMVYYGPSNLRGLGAPVRYEVTLEPHNRPWLLTLDAAVNPPTAPGLVAVMSTELAWMSPRPVTDLLRYSAESYVDFRHGPQSLAAILPEYTQLPPGFDPRTRELAARIMRDHPGEPRARVRAALDLLRTGGYVYTLEPGVYGQHTADEFWFDRKEGFCEHIASAFAVLMRAMNVPARIVTGYQGGERNSVDGFWTLRQADAHAWTELWLPGEGWVRIDPTSAVMPGRTGSFQRLQARPGAFAAAIGTVMNPTLAAQWRAAWEALNNSWNQWVLNYTQSRQLDLLRNLGFQSPSWEDLSYVLIAILVLLSLAGAAWSWWDRRVHDPWLRLLARARKRLAAAGLEAGHAAPPRQIATLVTARFGEDGRPLADWFLRLEAQRYAPRPQADLRALRREFQEIPWPA
jgi:transglutaminase-like putative cysteine protease